VRLFGLLKREPRPAGTALVKPFGIEVSIDPDQSLLQAALAAGIDFPHSCKVGTCSTCRCRLTGGQVKMIRDFSYVLTPEEIRDGYILACQSKVRPGEHIQIEVEIDNNRPHYPVVRRNGTISGWRELTHDIRELRVKLDEPFFYAAGQYASLHAANLDRPRDFSFASAPSESGNLELVFYVRYAPGGIFTGWLFQGDVIGQPVVVEGPLGDFWMRPARAPILFVAGGSGLAPIRALLDEAIEAGVAREAVFLFGARSQRDLYDTDAMARIGAHWHGNFRFVPVLSEEPCDSDWAGARGLVTELINETQVPRLDTHHVYLCGPPRMIDAALPVLAHAGIPYSHIHYDKFTDASTLTGSNHLP
jgi:NAD(P)H-flavin reductase/ferredoxin